MIFVNPQMPMIVKVSIPVAEAIGNSQIVAIKETEHLKFKESKSILIKFEVIFKFTLSLVGYIPKHTHALTPV